MGSVTPPRAVFGVSVVLSLVVWGIIGARDIWPALRRRSRADALRPLLLLHAFRFVGLAFLVPGVVSPELPDGFARSVPRRGSRAPREETRYGPRIALRMMPHFYCPIEVIRCLGLWASHFYT